MASTLYGGIGDALTDMFANTGQTFNWQGRDYGCALSVEADSLVTNKDLFGNILPAPGDMIVVTGKNRQIISVAAATAEFSEGGYVTSGAADIEASLSPALLIKYQNFITG